jgi:hypothetical protein
MSLSALIKKGGLRSIATATPATFATDTQNRASSVATVATVAVATPKTSAANDPPLPQDFDIEAFEERPSIMEFDWGQSCSEAERMASTTVDKWLNAPQSDVAHIDLHSWPHTRAMNTNEIDAYMVRTRLFTQQGLPQLCAEDLADDLVLRDRRSDDRSVCLECSHLRGRDRSWICGQADLAGLGSSHIPVELVVLLQRCNGFKERTR